MKILIPTSGGLDSAVLLYETLRDTDHEIVSVHIEEDFLGVGNAEKNVLAGKSSSQRVADWARQETRNFQFETRGSQKENSSGEPFSEMESHPIRIGFSETRLARWLRCRSASIGKAAEEFAVEEVWLALTTWDKAWWGYNWTVIAEESYNEFSTIPRVKPWISFEKDAEGNLTRVVGAGRLEVMRRTPPSLRGIIAACSRPGAENAPCGNCRSCAAWSFYDLFCAAKTKEEIQSVEDQLEKLAHYGKKYDTADPESYKPVNLTNILKDETYWEEYFGT